MNKRTQFFGKPKSSFGDHEYTYREAEELLGPCQRKTVQYGSIEETFYEESYNVYDEPVPAGWVASGSRNIIETYDVWINKRGDMLPAISIY